MLPQLYYSNDSEKSFLWEKIKGFNFDDPDAVIRFSDKLAAKQNWTAHYTKRVIAEYRKFIYLCCISQNGASPSKAVDEAWHLHLTYTQSYWTKLCKNILGRDLHHNPSNGGEEENRKYEKWYRHTLALYELAFKEVPPPDIWPKTGETAKEIEVHKFYPDVVNTTINLLLLCLPFLFIEWRYNTMIPFHLHGPQFLEFYLLLTVATCVVINRHVKERENKFKTLENQLPNNLNSFQLAEFFGGRERALQTAILDLVHKGSLQVEENKHFSISRNGLLPGEENPLAKFLAGEEEGKELSYNEIEKTWYQKVDILNPDLERMQETVNKQDFLKILPVMVFFLGFARIIQSWIYNMPTGYLIIEVVVFIIAVLVFYTNYRRIYMVYDPAISICRRHLNVYKEEGVISNFALRGKSGIIGLADGVLLSSIFFLNPSDSGGDSGGDGGGGDGGGGGGDGGGGGCGGCGGCGGGGCG